MKNNRKNGNGKSHKKRNQRLWGFGFIIAGFVALLVGGFFVYSYYMVKAMLVEEADPATVWEALANIYTYASVGSYYLAIGIVAFTMGALFIFIGIVILRR